MQDSNTKLYQVSTLIFLRDDQQRLLMLKRARSPNKGKWSPIGGKLEMSMGESPFECAIRETREETMLKIQEKDLHLFACVTEKNYENAGHWLMFLFDCKKKLGYLPKNTHEGDFCFFKRSQIEENNIPKSDKLIVWPLYDQFSEKGFASVNVDCIKIDEPKINLEEVM